jgi:hypothetical protein
MSRFFLCHSPLSAPAKDREGYIYHFDAPKFFAAITGINDNASFVDQNYAGYNIIFSYNRSDKHKQFYCLQVIQNIDKASKKMPAALHAAASWYCNCLDQEDHLKYKAHSTWGVMGDFNVLTPGLQILRLPVQKKFLISYDNGIKTVDNEEALDKFLRQGLGYPEVAMEKGIINTM